MEHFVENHLNDRETPWKYVEGFNDTLIITSTGQLYNTHGRLYKPYDSNGYLCVKITNPEGIRKTMLIHRLVLTAFTGPPPEPKMWTNHKDGDKKNNNLNNLEWTTPSQNHLHARDSLGRSYARGSESAKAKLNETSIELIRLASNKGWSQHKLAKAFGVSQTTIHDILKELTWKD